MGVIDAVRQWGTLTRRYFEVLTRDKFNLLILFGQAPIIAFLTYLVVAWDSPRDFPYFVMALVAIWYVAALAMNWTLVRDGFEREETPYTVSDVISGTMSAERPLLPAPHQVVSAFRLNAHHGREKRVLRQCPHSQAE